MLRVKSPGLPLFNIKFIGWLSWELAGVKSASGEGKNSLTHLSEGSIGLVHLLSKVIGEFSFLIVDNDFGASDKNSLWCTLHVDTKVVVVWVLVSVHVSNEEVELDVGREWDEGLGILSLVVCEIEGWAVTSGLIKVHNGLGELYKSGFGGITFAVSVGQWHRLLSDDESGLHFLGILSWKINSLKGRNSNLSHSCKELFGLIFSGVVVENGVSSEHNGLNKSEEIGVLDIITDLHFIIWLVLLNVS